MDDLCLPRFNYKDGARVKKYVTETHPAELMKALVSDFQEKPF